MTTETNNDALQNWINTTETYIKQRQNSIAHSKIIINSALSQIANLSEQIGLMQEFIKHDEEAIAIHQKMINDEQTNSENNEAASK